MFDNDKKEIQELKDKLKELCELNIEMSKYLDSTRYVGRTVSAIKEDLEKILSSL